MSKSKILGVMALIAFAMGIVLASDAAAGEYVKCRIGWHSIKWEQINVGDEKDHVVAVGEYKGIYSNVQGKTFGEGFLGHGQCICDGSPKTGFTCDGYVTMTDKDGDKAYFKWDQKPSGPNRMTFYKGTGKFKGIQGKGTWSPIYTADPTEMFADWEGEIELPR